MSGEPRPFEERLDQALDSASCWLQNWLEDGRLRSGGVSEAKGSFGENILGSLALATARNGKGLEVAPAVCEYIDRRWQANQQTYAISLALQFLAVLEDQAAQGSKGGWPPEFVRQRRWPRTRSLVGELVKALLRIQAGSGLWGYGSGYGDSQVDISNTRFALSGLTAAAGLGVETPFSTIDRAAAAIMQTQAKTGPSVGLSVSVDRGSSPLTVVKDGEVEARPFPYRVGETLSGSTNMDATLALCLIRVLGHSRRQETPQWAARIDDSVRSGIAWAAASFSMEGNPTRGMPRGTGGAEPELDIKSATHLGYYRWGVKLVCRELHLTSIQSTDWYRLGAEYFLLSQLKDGHWESSYSGSGGALESVETSFAVLFLAPTASGRGESLPGHETPATPR